MAFVKASTTERFETFSAFIPRSAVFVSTCTLFTQIYATSIAVVNVTLVWMHVHSPLTYFRTTREWKSLAPNFADDATTWFTPVVKETLAIGMARNIVQVAFKQHGVCVHLDYAMAAKELRLDTKSRFFIRGVRRTWPVSRHRPCSNCTAETSRRKKKALVASPNDCKKKNCDLTHTEQKKNYNLFLNHY